MNAGNEFAIAYANPVYKTYKWYQDPPLTLFHITVLHLLPLPVADPESGVLHANQSPGHGNLRIQESIILGDPKDSSSHHQLPEYNILLQRRDGGYSPLDRDGQARYS